MIFCLTNKLFFVSQKLNMAPLDPYPIPFMFINQEKFCYGKGDAPCERKIYDVAEGNSIHYNGCCIDCSKNNPFGICPCITCTTYRSNLDICFGSTNGPCVTQDPIHEFGMCLSCCQSFNDGICVCDACFKDQKCI